MLTQQSELDDASCEQGRRLDESAALLAICEPTVVAARPAKTTADKTTKG